MTRTERRRRPAAPAGPAGTTLGPRQRSVGILGGTFDPIHNGHLGLLRSALAELPLDEIVVVPAGSPPHKQGRPISDAVHRLAMVELAVADAPRISVDRVEIDRVGPSYTVDTVESLVEIAAGRGSPIAPTVILSADAFAQLPTWHEPDRLVRLARFAIAPRRGHAAGDIGPIVRALPALAGRVDRFEGPDLDVSASEIRARVAAGLPIDGLVPEAVAAYIAAHDLYRDIERRTSRT